MNETVIQIPIKYHEEKYGMLPRLKKIEIGNWVDVYSAITIEIPSIESVIAERKSIIEELNFYEKVEVSGIPLCSTNGITYLQDMKKYLIDQLKHIEKPILIPLGFSLQLPYGYEGYLLPRSSSFKSFNFLQTNSLGIVDEAYCGDGDEWFYPVIGVHKNTIIQKGDKIAQFRIQKRMPHLEFIERESLNNKDRGGHGSTGKN